MKIIWCVTATRLPLPTFKLVEPGTFATEATSLDHYPNQATVMGIKIILLNVFSLVNNFFLLKTKKIDIFFTNYHKDMVQPLVLKVLMRSIEKYPS